MTTRYGQESNNSRKWTKYAHSLVNGLSVPEGSKIRDWLSACSYQTDSMGSCKQLQANNNFKTNHQS
jgi:hypothetical protein